MKSATEMTVDEFRDHLKEMNEKVVNFHNHISNAEKKRPDRSYANQKRGNFFGKHNIFTKGKYDG